MPAEEHPADSPSPGLQLVDQRDCQLWWQGLDFLKRGTINWISNEVRKEEVCAAVAVVECSLEVTLLSVVEH